MFKRKRSVTKCKENAKKYKRKTVVHQPPPEEVLVDESGYLICYAGKMIQNRYKVEAILGEGAYGRVIRVKDARTSKNKAVKVFRNGPLFHQGALREISTLQLIALKDPEDTSLCIKILDWFDYHGHKCLVFEAFGMSVYDYMMRNKWTPYPLEDVRHIGNQLCYAVDFLHRNGITHTDIKPENLLFVDSTTEDCTTNCKDKTNCKERRLKSTEVRLIDFGEATRDGDFHSPIITTRYYRAPEVVLLLGWTNACDVWSIGCTLFELCFGNMLFPTDDDDLPHLTMMEKLLGPIPRQMATESDQKYFIDGKLKIKWTDDENEDFDDICSEIKKWFRESKDTELSDLIKRMLTYEPSQRITVAQALMHPFFKNIRSYQRNHQD